MPVKCSVPLPCLLINMMTKEKARDSIAYILGFKPVKTARHRVLVIVSHLFLWGLFLAMPLLIYRIRILDNTFIYRELVTKSFLVILFYINYYYLLPRFFQRRKVANYFLSITAALLLLCVVNIVAEYFFREHLRANAKHYILTSRMGPGGRLITVKDSVTGDGFFTQALPAMPLHIAGVNYREPAVVAGTVNLINDDTLRRRMHMWKQYFHTRHPQDTMIGAPVGAVSGVTMPAGMRLFRGGGPFGERGMFWMGFSMVLMNTLSSGVIILLISGFIKLANSFIISEKQKKALENERLNAELNFLKLQINPHFLFNTLNSIYSQAHLKSEQTEYSILKFSQIMRYVLYDSTTEKIPLKKDLEYIRNYIDLQKLRISKNITIQYDVTGVTSDLLIAPLLLITFIENAFKHGISYSSPSAIDIRIGVTGTDLTLTVGNTIIRHPSYHSERAGGGVGLVNARRRLDVLYPGRYLLDISDNNSIYVVNLKISLDHETDRDQVAHM